MKAVIIFGIYEGYSLSNNVDTTIRVINEDLKRILDEVEEETEIYISGFISQGQTIYKDIWGCPIGGETTLKYESSMNPNFIIKDEKEWKEAVITLANKLKKHFKQSTVTCEFLPSELIYLTNK